MREKTEFVFLHLEFFVHGIPSYTQSMKGVFTEMWSTKWSKVFVVLFMCIAVFGIFGMPKTVHAGSGSIPTFSVDNQLSVIIVVSCPGNTGMTWQVAVDSFDNVFYENGSGSGSFRLDGNRIGNGHHNALARVRCDNENWDQASSSTVGFDWYGGNPTAPPPPVGYEVSISMSVDYTTVPANSPVRITVQASCANTNVRAIRIGINGNIVYELGSPTVTYTWRGGSAGSYTIVPEVACNGDDSWKTTASAPITVSVVQNAQPSGGGVSQGTGGNQTTNTNPGNLSEPKQNQSGDASIPDAQQPNNPGGVDLIKVAYYLGYADVKNYGGANDWYWIDGNGRKVRVDFNQVCSLAYGSSYTARKVDNSAGGWKCVQGNTNSAPKNPQPAQPSSSGNDACSPLQSRVSVGDIGVNTSNQVLHPKSSANTGSSTAFNLPNGAQFSIVSGPVCAQSRTWWKIGYNGKGGWLPEANSNVYNFSPSGKSVPQPQPTVKPPAQKVQPNVPQPSDSNQINCDEGYGGTDGNSFNSDSHVGLISYYPQARNLVLRPPTMECVDYVRGQYPKLVKKTSQWGIAANWAANAKDAGYVTGRNVADAQPGDVIVWSSGCQGATVGHVAILTSPSDGQNIVVTEANWGKNDEQRKTTTRAHPALSCMSFIRVSSDHDFVNASEASNNGDANSGSEQQNPPSDSNGIASGNAQATDITWSFCMLCTSQVWVKFQLPAGKYDLNGARIIFNGVPVSFDDMNLSAGGTTDTATIHISAAQIQALINRGNGNLNDISQWHFLYVVTE